MPSPRDSSSPRISVSSTNLEAFADNIQFLWTQKVQTLSTPPNPLQFSRDFVQCSRPCIIQNCILNEERKPLTISLDEICDVLNPDETMLTVDVTPDGLGDCVRVTSDDHIEMFVQPKEYEMSLSEFRRRLRAKHRNDIETETMIDIHGRPFVKYAQSRSPDSVLPEESVVYFSRQNDCLRKEIPKLKDIFPSGIEWAAEAFAQPLDAVNLWMGNERAISSMHKDHYENLFYVASGEKIFTICPPGNVLFLYEHREYTRGVFQVNEESQQWEVTKIDGDNQVHWIAPDVSMLEGARGKALKERYPLLLNVKPLEVRVKAGEMLYLPSLWFHRVTQSCETIGVNWWYDMNFQSPLWCYFSFLQQLEYGPPEEATEDSSADKRHGIK